jgi:uncharacterized membrane protein YccF (DUF307 family)
VSCRGTVGARLVWLVLAGLWLAVGYAIAGVIMCLLIVTIPFGLQAFKLAGYSLWPFGRTVVKRPEAGGASVVGNIIWLLFAGWWLALLHLLKRSAVGDHDHRIAARGRQREARPAALWSFGREIVRSADVSAALAAYRGQQAEAQAAQEFERPIPPPVELPSAAQGRPGLAPGERRET